MATEAETPEILHEQLVELGRDYLLAAPLAGTVAEVRFLGRFQERTVVWRMRLMTLARCVEECGPLPRAPRIVRGAMHIEALAPACLRARVGLAVPVIDEPAVRKAIVMMRNYRALRLGWRVWGEP